jgi:hypothetical protein
MVVFRSDLEHEVQPSYASRMAVTLWVNNPEYLGKPHADVVRG